MKNARHTACLITLFSAACGFQWNAQAQNAPAVKPEQAARTSDASTAARFLEGCNEALERGVTDLGCQAPLYRNELERLKREALTTQNPQLLSFVGDAYRNPRAGIGDIGQAYRWYLMAAVRGDPRAMRRLSEMNLNGQGVPKDRVKAMGYARLAERLSQQVDTGGSRNTVTLINELGAEMAVEEIALAESFATQLEDRIRRQSGNLEAPVSAPREHGGVESSTSVPGMSVAPARDPAPGAGVPGSVLPGVPAPLRP